MEQPVIYKRANCRLCEGTDLELALPMKPSAIGDAYVTAEALAIPQECYPLSLYLCKRCGHLQALDIVNPEILFRNYIYSTSTSPGLVEHFEKYAKDVIKSVDCPQGSLVVEIGSNDGSLLRAFKDHGMKVIGVDPAVEIALKATSKGFETIPAFFTYEVAKTIKEKYGSAQIVAANNVFAHADNIIDIVKGIQYLLAPEGIFVFEVSYLVDMIEKNVFDTIYHEHVCHHRVEPLQACFKSYGMELFNVERIPTKGGSIRGFAKLLSSNRKVKPIVQELVEYEKQMNLDKMEKYQNFSRKIEKIKVEINDVLKKLQIQGRTSIAGYGASTPVTTTIYQFDLGKYLEFIADDNPVKQGRFSPGHHLPVLPSKAIYEKKPDCVVILAWQYADMIMRKHQKYLDEGGCFIVPLPEVQVYETSGLGIGG